MERNRKNKLLFGTLIALFVLGELIGCITIRYLYLRSKITDLNPLAAQFAEEISEGHTFVIPINMQLYACDAKGRDIPLNYDSTDVEQEVFKQEKHMGDGAGLRRKFTYEIIAEPFMAGILEGESAAAIERLDILPDITVIVGVPIWNGQEVFGALFVMVPASEYRDMLNAFSLVFVVTMALGGGLFGLFLRQYLKEVEYLEQTRRDYVANISHELKSPITSVKALMETLMDGLEKPGERGRYMGIMLREIKHLERLVQELLLLSRLQSGGMDFTKAEVDGTGIFLPVCRKYQALCEDAGVELEITEAFLHLPALYTNEERAVQLLEIFMDNAFKFVGEEDGRICLDAGIGKRDVTVMVRDNGAGIDKEALPHIFERFYKADTATNFRGSGLGLAIASEIAQGLRERLEVKSRPGIETVFSFTVGRGRGNH